MAYLSFGCLQMAVPTTFTSLGALYDADDTGCEVLCRLKVRAAEVLPIGWRDWKAASPVQASAGDSNPEVLNKLRFALPTVAIARAFDPDANTLPERAYNEMKRTLLKWPFTRALLIAPRALCLQVRGGEANHEEVIRGTAHLKPLFLSRKEASRQLSGAGLADSASPVQDIAVAGGHGSVSAIGAASPGSAPPSSASSKRSGSPSLLAGPHVKRPKSTAVAELEARQAAMERRTSRIEELLEQLVSQRSPAPLPLTSEGLTSGFEEDE